jgi:hypothetical protein
MEAPMRNGERGGGKIGLVIMILLLAAVIFVLVKVVPPRINAYEFKDYIENYARTESWQRSPDEIKKDLVEKARTLDLRVSEKDLTVNKGGGTIQIRAVFDVPVDLKVYTYVMHYEFSQNADHY